jgi:hypothetical protein
MYISISAYSKWDPNSLKYIRTFCAQVARIANKNIAKGKRIGIGEFSTHNTHHDDYSLELPNITVGSNKFIFQAEKMDGKYFISGSVIRDGAAIFRFTNIDIDSERNKQAEDIAAKLLPLSQYDIKRA